jgi:hypothetical protein
MTTPQARWYSPVEEAIIRVLSAAPPGEWVSSADVAVALKESGPETENASARLKILLANLACRNVLEAEGGKGYRLLRPK